MKFSALAFLALTTGALALPGPPAPGPKPPKPTKPEKPINNNNNNNNQNIQCGNGQSLYCCVNEGNKKNDVTCTSVSVGGIGGTCNGLQVCCQNNNGNQGCNVGNGGGKVIFKDESISWGFR
ncbi:uncharacterized protein B0J16DRAFT_409847 [Fusarium flagelliforme]|uniref:Hydrophobin 1 n=1 Tax=Fusarium flagelliforme TaxID=2675880 RepID=A0A395N6K8_9HYPO|nr:uncharacterized protein B0J16DRAFT_409847 [Fusarium flagelliforme]KAH7198322.1 hypothetical protein B0J16DRAFT_409847 [Fusarium flagelliforme]RFN55279.1 hydrophobin 1 [Fusarium flagelliforme]